MKKVRKEHRLTEQVAQSVKHASSNDISSQLSMKYVACKDAESEITSLQNRLREQRLRLASYRAEAAGLERVLNTRN